jgi:cellulose synthase/poly-beta-1,6-N-acetylglucosamine synthase-like glycosyltransferase
MLIDKIIFWASVLMVLWTYLGYFIFLKVISLIKIHSRHKEELFPTASLVITAYNEEKRIAQKIENALSLRYPADRLQIIAVSDGSTDNTVEIINSYCDRGVQLIANETRLGKHYGQGEGLTMAQGEIVVFTDATTFLEVDALEKIMRNFADPVIGCVSGMDRIRHTNGAISGEGAYVRYEMKLRDLEEKVGSLVGVSGSFYAVRRSLCRVWYPAMSSDFYMPIITRMNGLRSVLEPEAIGYYEVLDDNKAEFRRKVRTVVHGIDVLIAFMKILNPFKYGFFSIQMISHKLVRWLAPFCLILAFLANILLLENGLPYRVLFAGQIVIYGFAFMAYLIRGLQRSVIFKIPYFFVMANLSILVAWYQHFRGERYVAWDSTKR